jgi:hypothetical protein
VFIASLLIIRWASMNGPFFVERDIFYLRAALAAVLDTTNRRRRAATWCCPSGSNLSILLRDCLSSGP